MEPLASYWLDISSKSGDSPLEIQLGWVNFEAIFARIHSLTPKVLSIDKESSFSDDL